MKLLAILLLCVAAVASASEPPAKTSGATSDTTALVDAAKEAKAKRKTSTSKVITNKDLKKSKAKLIELSEKELPPVKKPEGPTSLEKQLAERKARDEAAVRLAAAEKNVADLQREMVRIEQSYFEENEPNVRDTVIVQKFTETKKKLETAKLELEAARVVHDATRIQ